MMRRSMVRGVVATEELAETTAVGNGTAVATDLRRKPKVAELVGRELRAGAQFGDEDTKVVDLAVDGDDLVDAAEASPDGTAVVKTDLAVSGTPDAVKDAAADAATGYKTTDDVTSDVALPDTSPDAVPADGAAGDVAVSTVMDLDEHAESLETDLLESEDLAQGAEEAAADIDGAVNVAQAMESFRQVMIDAKEGAGMDPIAARMFHIAQESMYRDVGMKATRQVSVENFGGATRRIHASAASLEALTEDLQKLWAYIQKAVTSAAQWIIEQWKKYFDAATSIRNRASKIAAAAKLVKDAPKVTEIENERLHSALYMGNSVDLGRALQEIVAVSANVGKAQQAIIALAKKSLSDNLIGKEPAATVTEAVRALCSPVEGVEGVLSRGPEMPGGMAIVLKATSDKAASCKLVVAPFSEGADSTATKLKVLSPEEITKACAGLSEMAKHIEGMKPLMEESNRLRKQMLSTMKQKLSASTETSAEEKEGFKALVTFCAHLLNEPSTSFSRYAINTSKAALDYLELSLRAYHYLGVKADAVAPTGEVAVA